MRIYPRQLSTPESDRAFSERCEQDIETIDALLAHMAIDLVKRDASPRLVLALEDARVALSALKNSSQFHRIATRETETVLYAGLGTE